MAPGDNGVPYNFGKTLQAGALSLDVNAYCEKDAVRVVYSVPTFAGAGAGWPGWLYLNREWTPEADDTIPSITSQGDARRRTISVR